VSNAIRPERCAAAECVLAGAEGVPVDVGDGREPGGAEAAEQAT